MNNKNTIIIFAIIVLVVIIGFFLLPIPRISLYYIGLFALVFAITASSISIISIGAIKNNNIILYSTSVGTSTLLYIIGVIISLLFINKFKDNISTFIFIQLFINSIYLIFLITINMSAKKIYQSEISTYMKKEEGQYKKPKRGGF